MGKTTTGYDRDSFNAALNDEGVTGTLAKLASSIFMQESGGGKNTKTSNAKAHGGMQIIPDTFKSVADSGWDINNPAHNMRAGIRYLKQLNAMAKGDPKLTAVGYYGGPGGMEKARNGIAVSDPRNPKAPNTLQYADAVVARMSGQAGLGMKAPESAAQNQSQPTNQPEQFPIFQFKQPQAAPAQPYEGSWGQFQANQQPVNAQSMGMYGVSAADVMPQSYQLAQAPVQQMIGGEGGLGLQAKRIMAGFA